MHASQLYNLTTRSNMDLNSSQKLFLHGVLFHYLAAHDAGSSVRSNVEEIMSLLEDDLLDLVPPRSNLRPEPPDEEDEEDDLEVEDEDEPHMYIDIDQFLDLPEVRVSDDVGRKHTFRFFDEGDGLMFELFDKNEPQKSTHRGPVRWVRRFGKSLLVMTADNDQFSFDVSKFPTEWTSLLRVGEKTGP